MTPAQRTAIHALIDDAINRGAGIDIAIHARFQGDGRLFREAQRNIPGGDLSRGFKGYLWSDEPLVGAVEVVVFDDSDRLKERPAPEGNPTLPHPPNVGAASTPCDLAPAGGEG